MQALRRMVMGVAVLLAGAGAGHAQDGGSLEAMVAALGSLDPAVASELAFLAGDPEVVAEQVETYVTKAGVTRQALEVLALAEDAHFAATDSYRGRTAAQIGAEIDRLDPAAASHAEAVARLEAARETAAAHEARLRDLESAAADAQAAYGAALAEEDAALLSLSGGIPLSAEARAALRTMLGY